MKGVKPYWFWLCCREDDGASSTYSYETARDMLDPADVVLASAASSR